MGIDYLLLLQNFREATGGILDGFFYLITQLGDMTALIVVLALIYYALDKKLGSYLVFNSLFGLVLNAFLKITACVYRPWVLDSRVHPVEKALAGATGYSFPSGHSTMATALWGGLAFKKRDRKIIMIPAIILWLLICFSRNYLGVHTPQDAVVACVIGIALLFVTELVYQLLENRPELDAAVAVIVTAVGILLMVYAMVKNYPAGVEVDGILLADPAVMRIDSCSTAGGAIGFALGWLFERRCVNFQIEGGVLRRVLRIIFGVGTILAVKILSKMLLALILPPEYTAALSLFCVVFWTMGLYPYFMTKTEKLLVK